MTIINIFCGFIFAAVNIQGASNDVSRKNEKIPDSIFNVLTEYKNILDFEGWKTELDKNRISGTLTGYDFREIILTINFFESPSPAIEISGTSGRKKFLREFFLPTKPADYASVRSLILPYLLQIKDEKTMEQPRFKVFYSELSLGYQRIRDSFDMLKDPAKGSAYFNFDLTYDPAKNSSIEKLSLYPGDYLTFNLMFALNYQKNEKYMKDPVYPYWNRENKESFYILQEHQFSVDFLIYGKQTKDNIKNTRKFYGFFNGIEYYRPAFRDHFMLWTDDIYSDTVHFQYLIYRCAALGGFYEWKGFTDFRLDFMTGFGPSINSSLVATGIEYDMTYRLYSEQWREKFLETLDSLNDVFRGKYYQYKSYDARDQNFYYSASVPVSFSISMTDFFSFNFSAGYNFYYFFSIENARVYDIAGVFSTSAGYSITENTIFNMKYERWHIYSVVEDKNKFHQWNRVMFELKFIL